MFEKQMTVPMAKPTSSPRTVKICEPSAMRDGFAVEIPLWQKCPLFSHGTEDTDGVACQQKNESERSLLRRPGHFHNDLNTIIRRMKSSEYPAYGVLTPKLYIDRNAAERNGAIGNCINEAFAM